MVFKNFRLKLIFRVLLLGIIIFLFIYSMNQDKWYVTSAVSLSAIIISLIEMIYFMESTNREIGKLILSIKHKDFSSNYLESGSKKTSFTELRYALKEVTDEFQNAKIEKELHYQYLLTVFEHSKAAIICHTEDGNIELINQATKNLLKIKKISSIDDIADIDQNLLTAINSIRGESEKMVKINIANEQISLNLQCTIFKLKGVKYKMISLHNISEALDTQELESWKKLIRILNHEIMNSVTPISSLSAAINKMLLNEDGQRRKMKDIKDAESEDIFDSLETIENRSKGLLKFVTTYKELSKLPKPRLSETNINGLINHLTAFMKPEFQKHDIQIQSPNPDIEIMVNIDAEMIEQVMINLLLNAIQAVQNKTTDKHIKIETSITSLNTLVMISDNGSGIEKDLIDQIFIPFFTTKKEGSGIGLSLSRQIMQLHKGSISLQSEINSGTTFILKFLNTSQKKLRT